MSDPRPTLAITAGDPAGIGPEIVARAIHEGRLPALGKILVFAEPVTFGRACELVGLAPLPRSEEAVAADEPVLVPVEQPLPEGFTVGRPSEWTGRVAAACIEGAARCAMDGRASAVVTAPIAKAALHSAGVPFPGHTEFLADITGAREAAMMFVADDLRLTLATIHHALADVPALITPDGILEKIRLTRETLVERARVPEPRIAVLGLNPHAGEAGLFGQEEYRAIEPALQRARERGWDVDGPFPADSFFLRHRRDFDAVLAMYHDQGLIPLKLLGGGKAVNVTIGLPILRTSVDHGTAFDIAGRGLANADSLVAAARLAADWA